MIEDEFTIPRPRWVVPVAILGAALLALGVVLAGLLADGDEGPEIRFTGGTTSVVTTVPVPTTALQTTTLPTTTR
jgi:hypothetical protein